MPLPPHWLTILCNACTTCSDLGDFILHAALSFAVVLLQTAFFAVCASLRLLCSVSTRDAVRMARGEHGGFFRPVVL